MHYISFNNKAMLKNIIIISFLLLVNSFRLFSQQPAYTDHRTFFSEIDSLENVIKDKSISDEDLLDAYYRLSFAYSNDNQDKYAHYTVLSMELAKKMKDYVTESITIRNYISYLSFNGKNDSVQKYHERALEVLEEIKKIGNEELTDREYSLLAGTMGNHYSYNSNEMKAIEEYQKALRIFEKYNQKESMVILHTNVASLYSSIENFKQAEVSLLKALEITKGMTDTMMMIYVKKDLCDLEIRKGNYEQAKEYATFCLDYHESSQFDAFEMSDIYCTLSEIYRDGYNDYDKAEYHALQAMKLAEQNNSIKNLCNAHLELGKIYMHKGEWKKAEINILKCLELDDSELNAAISCHRNLTRIYIYMNEQDKAIEHFTKANELQSRLNNEQYQSALSEMEVRYDTETKELRIATLETEKRLQFWITICIIFIVILMAVWFLFLWRWAVEKSKIIKQKKDLEVIEARMRGESEERIRLSRDLHDGLGGMLTGVKLKMELMNQNRDSNKDYNDNFNDSMRILRESMTELRRISHHLMPISLRTNGLKSALNDFCSSFNNVAFDFYGDATRLEPQMEMLIYRIVHELVNNAIKHSGAEHIVVQVMQETEYIALIINDDGCGFDVNSTMPGMGLKNIRERVSARNGRLEISSEIGNGTEINIEFNLKLDNDDSHE